MDSLDCRILYLELAEVRRDCADSFILHTKKANGTMARTSKSAAGPTGILIGPPSKPWRVGRELGRGACGSVHDIGRVGSSRPSSAFVVKIATLPAAASTAKKRKKKTPEERNADLLYQENVYYRNVLNDLRGAVVPEVPHAGEGGPPGYGDLDGECSKPGADRFMCIRLHLFILLCVLPYRIKGPHTYHEEQHHHQKHACFDHYTHNRIGPTTYMLLIDWMVLFVGRHKSTHVIFLFIQPIPIISPQAFAICAWRRWRGPSRTSFPSW